MAAQEQLTSEPANKLSFSVFATDRHGETDRFEAWRQSIGVLFDVEPRVVEGLKGFSASVGTYNLGEILVSGTHFGAEYFSRGRRRVASDGIDHYLVQLYYAGALVGSTRRNEMKVRPGDIQILDLAQPHTSTVLNSSTIVITIRRDLMAELVSSRADLHGMILRGDAGAGGLLADYMRSLFARLTTVDQSEAPFIARATAQMIAACLYPTAHNTAQARAQIEGTVTERLKGYIDANLSSSDLSPDGLCRRFRISRSQLYRIFEPLGGVARYIQARRLDSAFALLRDPTSRHRPVYEIALGLGFSSVAHFSGAFRRQFGFSPSELRSSHDVSTALDQAADSLASENPGYEYWIRTLGQQRADP